VVDQLMTGRQAFSHILFDLDHTLSYYPLSTVGVLVATFERLRLSLEPFGPAHDLASRYDALWVALERGAESTDELRLAVWRRLLMERELSADGLAERIAAAHGTVRRANGVRLFDGTRELLSDLRAVGYGLGLLTNGLSDGQWEKIRSLRIESHFDAVVVAGDVNVYKPDPRAFAVLLDRLGARAPRALFVGDSYEMDILGAHAAGLATVWIRPEGTPLPGDVVPRFAFPRAVDVREVIL
jgi:HAD superfamily hydrolase (TIGR01509 family)